MKEVSRNHIINGRSLAVVVTETDSKKIVVFCHGYRGTSVGPHRFFVTASRLLAKRGIGSFRFDQYGSGNSDGEFMESRFDDWVQTTVEICKSYIDNGYDVALFGQSMGASTVIVAASQLPGLAVVVCWVPDPSIEVYTMPKEGYFEEDGERVSAIYWQQAHAANIAHKLQVVKAPMLIIQCTNDMYVSEDNRLAIEQNSQKNHLIQTHEGYTHSSWTYSQAQSIINDSINFISNHIGTVAK